MRDSRRVKIEGEDRSAFARCLKQDDLRVNESLDNGHSGLGELLLGVSTGGVGWMSVMAAG